MEETAGGAEQQQLGSTTGGEAAALADDGEEEHAEEEEEEGEEHNHDHDDEEEEHEEGDEDEEHDHDHEEGEEHEHHEDEEGEDHDHDHQEGEEDGEEHDHDHDDEHDHDEGVDGVTSEFETFENSANESKPWGPVILATFLVNLATLIGLIVLIPTVLRSKICCGSLKRQARRYTQSFTKSAAATALGTAAATGGTKKRGGGGHGRLIDIAIPSFAAGALLAATVFLILPESIYLLGLGSASMLGSEEGADDNHDGHDHGAEEEGVEGQEEEEHDHDHDHFRRLQDDHDGHDHGPEGLEWKFGCAVLGGFLLPMVLGALFPRASEHDCDAECGERPDLRDSSNNLALERTFHHDARDCCAHKAADAAAAGDSDDDELSVKMIDEEGPVDDAVTATKSAMSNCSSCCEKGKDCDDPDDCIALDHDHSHHDHEGDDGAYERYESFQCISKGHEVLIRIHTSS